MRDVTRDEVADAMVDEIEASDLRAVRKKITKDISKARATSAVVLNKDGDLRAVHFGSTTPDKMLETALALRRLADYLENVVGESTGMSDSEIKKVSAELKTQLAAVSREAAFSTSDKGGKL